MAKTAVPEIISNSRLYHGDALKIIPDLIEKSIFADCVVTDPPYLLTSGGCTQGGLHERFGKGESKYGNSGEIVPCDIDWKDFMPGLFGILKTGHAYVMSNNRNIQAMMNSAEDAGFRFHNLLVWDKRTATPNRWYMKNCEFTGLFFKGPAQAINNCGSMQLISVPQVDESEHPTEKPVMLMRHYIENSTKPGDLVIDPFMGSGTTGVACQLSGRRFIGIEKEKRFFEIAADRIKKSLLQPKIKTLL